MWYFFLYIYFVKVHVYLYFSKIVPALFANISILFIIGTFKYTETSLILGSMEYKII